MTLKEFNKEKQILLDKINQITDLDELRYYMECLKELQTIPIKRNFEITGHVINAKEFDYKCLKVEKGEQGFCTIDKSGNCTVKMDKYDAEIKFASEYYLEQSFYWRTK